MVAYQPKTWVDGRAGGTPINAAALNRMEQGIAAAGEDALAVAITDASSPLRAALLNLFGQLKWQLDSDGVPYFTEINVTTPPPSGAAVVGSAVVGTAVVG